jgi:hypothetical protein
MSTVPALIQAALNLPEAERAELACQIILSLEADWPGPRTDISEGSLATIIKLRSERAESGECRTYTLDETMAYIRAAMTRLPSN